jgi:hypothetical protein
MPWCHDCADSSLLGVCDLHKVRCDKDEFVQFIGLNPSTADETHNDPTVRRCMDFAKRWGYSAMCMTNIFAWRDTDPLKMKAAGDPIGYENDDWLVRVAKGAHIRVACWGNDGAHLGRGVQVGRMIPHDLHCLGTNADGSPKHPLYLSKLHKPQPFNKWQTRK